MRYTELNEAFDAGSVSWIERDDHRWRAKFDVNGVDYTVIFQKANTGWSVQFITFASDGWSTTNNTGEMGQSAPKVFGGVLQAVKEFLTDAQPASLSFSGDKGQGKGNLYARMAKALASRLHALGYEVGVSSEDDRNREFTISPKELVMEGAEEDLAALDIAKQASSAFAKWLIPRNEETPLKDVMRETRYGGKTVYAVAAAELGLEYDDLMICIGEGNGLERGRLMMYHMKTSADITYYALIMYAGLPKIDEQVDVGFSLNWNTFVHEFVHYLDHKRGYAAGVIRRNEKAYRAKVDRLIAGKEPEPAKAKWRSSQHYLNDPIEVNGHFKQGLSDVVDMLARALAKHPDHGFTWTFPQFRQMALIHMPKSFHLQLQKKNSRSIDKRLYKLWEYMRNNWPNVELIRRLVDD